MTQTRHAFVDESGRGSDYYVAAAFVAGGDVDALRRVSRSLCMPGQRRWHFTNERDRRRRQIIDALVDTGQIRGFVYFGRGQDATIRAASLRALVSDLAAHQVTRLTIESREGRDHLDRQTLLDELRRRPRLDLAYYHQPSHADPLLWVADAIAWCYSAGGTWRKLVHPMIEVASKVG